MSLFLLLDMSNDGRKSLVRFVLGKDWGMALNEASTDVSSVGTSTVQRLRLRENKQVLVWPI